MTQSIDCDLMCAPTRFREPAARGPYLWDWGNECGLKGLGYAPTSMGGHHFSAATERQGSRPRAPTTPPVRLPSFASRQKAAGTGNPWSWSSRCRRVGRFCGRGSMPAVWKARPASAASVSSHAEWRDTWTSRTPSPAIGDRGLFCDTACRFQFGMSPFVVSLPASDRLGCGGRSTGTISTSDAGRSRVMVVPSVPDLQLPTVEQTNREPFSLVGPPHHCPVLLRSDGLALQLYAAWLVAAKLQLAWRSGQKAK